MNKRKGFTLVELVVAIAILGIITLFALPSIRSIQGNNKDSKYIAYEKSIISAGKLYVDSYSQDLFGPHKTGCAIIKYSDLEERDYVSKIQLKNTDCGSDDTYIMVRKSESGNFHYDPNVVCRENGELVYGTVAPANFEDMCKLGVTEPTIELYDVSEYKNQPAYKKGQKPEFKVKIADAGIGLLEKQKLNYQWLVGENVVSSGTIDFNNKTYAPYSVKPISNPPNMGEDVGTTVYTLKLTGTIKNVDGRENSEGASKAVKTFIGRVLIKYHANGGKLAEKHGEAYSLKNEYVYKNNKIYIQQIVEGGTLPSTGLVNWNSAKNINLTNARLVGNPGKEWNTKADGTGTSYNQTDQYVQTDFCTIDYTDCNITLYVNWVKPLRTLTYNSNGGSACDPPTKTVTDGSKWGKLCKPKRSLYKFVNWIDKKTKKKVTKNTKATKDITVVAKWKKLELKPKTPKIKNPSGGKWTKYNISLGISTTTPAKYLGKWYYTYSGKKFSEFKTKKNKSTEGLEKFNSKYFKKEMSKTAYVRVCSIYASGPTDSKNCSDYASTPLRIDKTPPVYHPPGLQRTDGTYHHWSMIWKDNLSGLSTVNTGNYSQLYYCYGPCNSGCTSRCCSDHGRDGYMYKAKYNPGEGFYMRQALVEDNFVKRSTAYDELSMETFKACNGGDYTVYLEAHICDQANNCVWQNEKFDF